MTEYVFKPSRRKNGKLVQSRMYSGRYRRPGETKVTAVALHVTDRAVAEEKLRQLIRDMEKEVGGGMRLETSYRCHRRVISNVANSTKLGSQDAQ